VAHHEAEATQSFRGMIARVNASMAASAGFGRISDITGHFPALEARWRYDLALVLSNHLTQLVNIAFHGIAWPQPTPRLVIFQTAIGKSQGVYCTEFM